MYDGPAEFVARTLPIVQHARTDGAAVLVVVPEPRLTALRTAVGDATTDVTFTDMTMVGRNPGRIISVWDDFVRGQAGGRVVGIGEPIWSGRSRDELVECQIHEELLDTAFAESEGVEIQCPYDVGSLSGDVITEACRGTGRPHLPAIATRSGSHCAPPRKARTCNRSTSAEYAACAA